MRVMFPNRMFQMSACGVTLVLCAVAGQAEPKPTKDKHACTNIYKTAQERQHAGKVREAVQLLSTCTASCNPAQKKKCATVSSRLEADIPSIIPGFTDDTRTDVQVRMDGELLTSRLDGRALPVDPGVHEFTFITEKGIVATQRVSIERGQHGQPISVALHASDKRGRKETTATAEPKATLASPALIRPSLYSASPDAAPASDESRKRLGPPTLAFVTGGVGVVGLGTALLLNIWARQDNSDLQAACSPNCPSASVDHVRKLYFAADVSLGVGVVGLGLASYLFLKPRYATENPPTRAAYTVDVQPTPSGAFATVSGVF
jgi:hypothetical protein